MDIKQSTEAAMAMWDGEVRPTLGEPAGAISGGALNNQLRPSGFAGGVFIVVLVAIDGGRRAA